MAAPFVAEIRIWACNFAPTGWALCAGQLIPISQNTALFSLLGTFYGGDGKSTFALPNFQGSVPVHQGQGPGLSQYFLGQQSGTPAVTLIQSEMPVHTHIFNCTNQSGDKQDPTGTIWSKAPFGRGIITLYHASPSTGQMALNAVAPNGGSQPHNNMMPYLTLNFCIAMQGVFPARN